jgi:hypothetical protein
MMAARPVVRTLALAAAVTATVGPAAGQSPRKFHFRVLNTLVDVAAALETCWEANEPPLEKARPGMNVTVMLNFNRSGEIFGEPRFTYVTPEASAETKALYQRAVVAALDACVPLPFSPALGNALAGIPKIMPFIDRRNEKGI